MQYIAQSFINRLRFSSKGPRWYLRDQLERGRRTAGRVVLREPALRQFGGLREIFRLNFGEIGHGIYIGWERTEKPDR